MTPESTRAGLASQDASTGLDLIAGLWQEASFPRLPPNAPPELHSQVRDIDNPMRVYAIHRASRRHDLQILIERFIIQLRNGCGRSYCTTPTCFSYRKRLAGDVPLRRYNTTSARTLAVYLASQDNPEASLCRHLVRAEEVSAALGTLVFSRPPSSPSSLDGSTRNPKKILSRHKEQTSEDTGTVLKDGLTQHKARTGSQGQANLAHVHVTSPEPRADEHRQTIDSGVRVMETPVSKDHRSFAANLFSTVAFKMLDWMNPRGVATLSQQMSTLTDVENTVKPMLPQRRLSGSQERRDSQSSSQAPGVPHDVAQGALAKGQEDCNQTEGHSDELQVHETSHLVGAKARQLPPPKPRPPSSPKPNKGLSHEAFQTAVGLDDAKPTILSPTFHSLQHERQPRNKTNSAASGRGVPDTPTKTVLFESLSPSPVAARKTRTPQSSVGFLVDREGEKSRNFHAKKPISQAKPHHKIEKAVDILAPGFDNLLPQTLTKLDVDTIQFICDVFVEDHTFEDVYADVNELVASYPKLVNSRPNLKRKPSGTADGLKTMWREFNQQSVFNVLSDPHSAIHSFILNDQLYDSQTMWYCLHRLTRVTPSLVFHSLWLAAEALFNPHDAAQRRSPLRNGPRNGRTYCTMLSSREAGQLLSICMHALVAATPVVSDSRTLYELSRIRSHGITLVRGSAVARQPPSRCLAYDDAFSNDGAIRLARRLFCAITARRCFVQMLPPASRTSQDILQPLLEQLDFLSANSVPILEFAQSERLLHETRVPTVLLDWARTVLLRDWDGQPYISMDSPFGGALTFIETMHENRNSLLLGDIQFRVDYFSDQLDAIDMPIQWLAFRSTKWHRHILDYPYIFDPDTLVSFFRSINFARMSRTFEESSSLKTRMSAIVDPGSLIANPHHKMVLQDLLKTASSKYLILNIDRNNVVRDAFDQLWRREERELLRPLKVHLGEDGGEEGFDSGGVQQEFFRLAIAECLDPAFGAFTVDERTRMVWFSPGSLVESWKFELIGLLVSLALYNGLTLPVTFPKALYRKLLGKPVNELHHVADGWPELASGLTTLLEWDERDGPVEDIFARTYEFSVAAFGMNITRDMSDRGAGWPKAATMSGEKTPSSENPDNAPLVTNENRDVYVNDYICYLTDVSVRSQYLAFERGFHACLDKKSLSLLNPTVLQSLLEGVQDLDVSELRRYARYVGWDASHRAIKDFWSIVKRYDDRMKRRLLEFVTSSDRIPVGGMKNVQFVIQKNGEEEGDSGHLPTAYTCYGTLLLPEYRDKEVLRERLAMALENAQGFGFA